MRLYKAKNVGIAERWRVFLTRSGTGSIGQSERRPKETREKDNLFIFRSLGKVFLLILISINKSPYFKAET